MKTYLNLFALAFLLIFIKPLAADSYAPQQADSFVDSVGLVVHLSATNYSNWTTLEPLVTGLGIRHVRDGVSDTATDAEFVDLAYNYGIKATIILDYRSGDIPNSSLIPSWITYLQTTTYPAYGGSSLLSAVESIEGPNEYDINCPTGDTNWVTELTTYQQALFNDVSGNSAYNSVAVLAPSMGNTLNMSSLPNMTSMCDLGNAHPYTGTENPGYPVTATYLHDAQPVFPALPLQASEDGYTTIANSNGVTEAVQAEYVPRLVLENFRRGMQRTYVDEMVDADAPTDTTYTDHHFGLVHLDLSTKPAYTSLKNLISILSDPGASFTMVPMSFALSGTTTDVHSLLLEKRSKVYYLALWVENTTTDSQPVTVTFGDTIKTVQQYNPDSSTTPTTLTLSGGNAVSVTLTDAPMILAVTPLYPTPGDNVKVDTLANLTNAASYLNWQTVTTSNLDWLGATSAAERTVATSSNSLIYSSVDIRSFTAKLGLPFNTALPDGVTYAFGTKVLLYASPDNSTWTSVPTYVGAIDKTETQLAQAGARWFAPVSPAGELPAGTNYVKLVINSTDAITLPQVFQTNLNQAGDLEAESMSYTSSGATTTLTTDVNATGGKYVLLNATGTGQSVTFTSPVLPPGKYNFWYRWGRGTNRGIAQPTIDGVNQIANDQYSTSTNYYDTKQGSVTFTTAASHTFGFSVTGKNASSTGYTLCVDRICLIQQ